MSKNELHGTGEICTDTPKRGTPLFQAVLDELRLIKRMGEREILKMEINKLFIDEVKKLSKKKQ